MKKRKLRLKDMISYLENKLIPDLDAVRRRRVRRPAVASVRDQFGVQRTSSRYTFTV